jgi:zinc/manganese transport system permease protein
VAVVAGLAMGWFGERLRGRDIAIGTTLAWTLGLGALFLTLFNASVNPAIGITSVSALFGNLLGVTSGQTQVIVIAAILEIAALAIIARPLLFASLDPEVARARARWDWVSCRCWRSRSVWRHWQSALLIFALLLLPAATAQLPTTRPYAGMGLAALLAVLVAWIDIAVSFYSGLPGSVCVSLPAFALYAVTLGYTRLRPVFRWRGHLGYANP